MADTVDVKSTPGNQNKRAMADDAPGAPKKLQRSASQDTSISASGDSVKACLDFGTTEQQEGADGGAAQEASAQEGTDSGATQDAAADGATQDAAADGAAQDGAAQDAAAQADCAGGEE